MSNAIIATMRIGGEVQLVKLMTQTEYDRIAKLNTDYEVAAEEDRQSTEPVAWSTRAVALDEDEIAALAEYEAALSLNRALILSK